jgi:hypothetical protein
MKFSQHERSDVMIKKINFFILFITIIFFIMPTTQAVNQQGLNYLSLKDEYIKNHPGQVIIPYPWNPTTSTKVLPFNYEIPAYPSNNFSITACRDQFESASFIINSQKGLSGIEIYIPDLKSSKGTTIPADAINVRLVKVWYQASEGTIENEGGVHVLTPELLIKDDSLVNVDYVNQTNYLKVSINGSEQYIDISSPTATFPSNAQVYDASSLQPFSLKANETKQIWLTVHIPSNTPTGDYFGNITITAPSEVPVVMNFSVTVMPFDLEPAPVEYGLFYRGIIENFPPNDKLNSEYKTTAQYAAELQNMKEHGVLYPTLYQGDNIFVDTALLIRNQSGLPKDKIYIVGDSPDHLNYIGNATNQTGLTTIANKVINWRNHTETYGYKDTYFYGIDEAESATLVTERPAWLTVHNNGGKMFVASWTTSELIDSVGDVLDIAVLGTSLNTTQAAVWHNYGHKIFLYNQPQVGVEDPEIYRNNYGFTLWNSGYDGTMNYAYQATFGQSIWNDFDDNTTNFRDHVFAYPTSNSVIDTIQWEGWREGVDDTRYMATLIKLEGSETTSHIIVTGSLANGDDMSTIRKKVIKQILISQPAVNEKLKIDAFNDVLNITRTTFGMTSFISVNRKWE